jgi:hypothetical protein
MPSVIQRRNPNRGRPRSPVPSRPPLAHSVPQWSKLTGESEQTTRRKIKAGAIRSVQGARGLPHRIPTSEYVRLGFIKNLSELLP